MAISPLSQIVCNKKSPLTPLYEQGFPKLKSITISDSYMVAKRPFPKP